jgi:superfamily II DNA or RNA helicase/uncharacterized protein (DUF3820 family)
MIQKSFFDELSVAAPRPEPIGDIVPRPYQADAANSVFDRWNEDQSTLVVLPTGCGKSIIFSEVMRRVDELTDGHHRMLVLAHRSELIFQAVNHASNAGLEAGIEMSSYRCSDEAVVVSTVQTLNAGRKCPDCEGKEDECDRCEGVGKIKRMTKFDPMEFSTLIIDEAHHATAKSYRAVIKYFMQNNDLRVLMVTATPRRRDKIGLHNVCDSVAYEMDLQHAIKQGWLVPIRQQFIHVDGLDLSRVSKKAGGDLADGELERAFLGETDLEEEEMLHAITYPTIEISAGRPVLVFASGQEHAAKLTAAFNAYDGVTAELVIDKTDKQERSRIIQRYRDEQTQILVNVGCFTEGFDAPKTAVIANARPTASEGLYLQMIGRGTRPLAGIADDYHTPEDRREAIAKSAKSHVIILDFTGVSGQHQIVSVADVLAGKDVDPMDLKEAIRLAKKDGEAVDIEEMIAKAKEAREAKEKRLEEERRRRMSTAHYAESGSYDRTDVDLFASARFDPMVDYTPAPNGASNKQVKYLISLGVSPEQATKYTKRQAATVITKIKNQTGSQYIVSFGKHKGRKLSQIPKGYIQWMKKELSSRTELMQNIRLMEGSSK